MSPTRKQSTTGDPPPLHAVRARAEASRLSRWGRRWQRAGAAGLTASLLLHSTAVVMLGLVIVRLEMQPPPPAPILASLVEPPPELEQAIEIDTHLAPNTGAETSMLVPQPTIPEFHVAAAASYDLKVAPPTERNHPPLEGLVTMLDHALLEDLPQPSEPSLSTIRSDHARRSAVLTRGGNDQSEEAVHRALEWLTAHQYPDGGWSFDHRGGECGGQCTDAGAMANARVAATAMALLPYLGAGHTHKRGKYKHNIQAGLAFLMASMQVSPDGGDLQALGTMYSHGLATIALSEAYGLSLDRKLLEPAQLAVKFVSAAQDPVSGGWRYVPGQSPGDTSALGWQVMALKSGAMAHLVVRPDSLNGAGRFLDSVALDDGAEYLYMDGYDTARPSTTAIGLLCRMYLGWPRETPALQRGVAALDTLGPSPDDFYFNYYATQVMHHNEGEPWERWNARLRDQLISTQSRQGHMTGSWYAAGGEDNHNMAGGRLYCTCLATLMLEVYYRHLPLYRSTSLARPAESTP